MNKFETGRIEETGETVQYCIHRENKYLPAGTHEEPGAIIPGSQAIHLELQSVPSTQGTLTLVLADNKGKLPIFIGPDGVHVIGGPRQ